MLIKNLTPKMQKITLEELLTGNDFEIYLEGNSETDVEGFFIPNIEKYERIISIDGIENIPTTPKEEIEEDTLTPEDGVKGKTPEIAPDKFICDICGEEFASSRGLTSHKNRVHAEK